MPMQLLKGDILQCAEGHDMFEMLVDATTGDVVRATSMKACSGLPEPIAGMEMPNCPVCGGPCVGPGYRPVRIKRH